MTFPAVVPDDLQLTTVSPTRVTTTMNNREQRLAGAYPYFRMFASYTNLTQSEARSIFAHIQKYGGALTSFTFLLPDYVGDSTAGYSGSITNCTASVGATSISGTVSSSGAAILKAGDLIKIGTDTKLYTVTQDATAVGTTVGIAFYPALRTAISAGAITHTNLSMTVRYASDNADLRIPTNLYGSFGLEFIEVLS